MKETLSGYRKKPYIGLGTTSNPKYHSKYSKAWRIEKRLEALRKISGGKIKCVRCGIKDIRVLDINHKNGGGRKELKKNKLSHLSVRIALGNRKISDLEILCRNCNYLHWLELKQKKNV